MAVLRIRWAIYYWNNKFMISKKLRNHSKAEYQTPSRIKLSSTKLRSMLDNGIVDIVTRQWEDLAGTVVPRLLSP